MRPLGGEVSSPFASRWQSCVSLGGCSLLPPPTKGSGQCPAFSPNDLDGNTHCASISPEEERGDQANVQRSQQKWSQGAGSGLSKNPGPWGLGEGEAEMVAGQRTMSV